jgi:cellulose biosynthesis protein BcsQ
MKTIAIYSMKGGVGKTATAVNLAYCAAKNGNFTLICDLDPQAASTFYFRIKASKNFNASKFIKGGKNIDKNIKGTDFLNLDLLPSKLSYRNFDLALDALKNSTKKLKAIFKEIEDDYDYLFLDCPPGISLISENVFNASDIILVPLIPTTLSVRSYIKLLKFFKKNKMNNSKIYPFFSMVEKRKSMHIDTINRIGKKKNNFLTTQIPYRSDIEKMGIEKRPVPEYAENSPASESYFSLWEEINSL